MELRLGDEERQLLGHLLPQLTDVLGAPDHPDVRRLFPTAYPDDAERDADYQRYMREELVASRSAALETVLASMDKAELDAAELAAWMQTLNAARLVLGTRLDVGEGDDVAHRLDPDDPDEQAQIAYHWLSALLEEATRAAMADLD